MAPLRWFYQSAEQWKAIRESLKLTPCPHCQVTGMLICHGFLKGYDDTSPQRKTIRAHRIFCSNRNARRGCGRTVTVWQADKLRRLSVTTHTLWKFLELAVATSVLDAMRTLRCPLSDRTLQRLWRRFRLAQSNIRTTLTQCCPPPEITTTATKRSTEQTLAHLQVAFSNENCPITAFQRETCTFFL